MGKEYGDCPRGCGLMCHAGTLGGPCERLRLVDLATREPIEEDYAASRSTLETAMKYVAGPRSRYYGHPLDNHGRTAQLQTSYLIARGWTPPVGEAGLTEEDVCWLNVQQKIARDMHSPVEDGPIDVAGYAANVAEIRDTRERRATTITEVAP